MNEIPTQRLVDQIKTVFGPIALPENLADTEESIFCCFRPHQVQVSQEPVADAVTAKVLSSSFMGHAYQLRLLLASDSTIILAQVDHQQHFSANQQLYVSVDLAACFFFASGDDTSIAITSQLEQAVQV